MAIRSLLRRTTPFLLRPIHFRSLTFSLFHPLSSTNDAVPLQTKAFFSSRVEPPPPSNSTWESKADRKKWSTIEAEIYNDVQPMTLLSRRCICADGYVNGQPLSAEDEKAVLDMLLCYHPHSEDKIGTGVDYITVDQHPQHRYTRCLFVVRTDGSWEDFSYLKCICAYIRDKYPSYVERYIRHYIKHGRLWK